MSDPQAEIFSQHRSLLLGIALRMLGNAADAEDVLQEAFLRWERTAEAEVRSPKAFLITIVTRLCLNHLDLARVKSERHFGMDAFLDRLPSEDTNSATVADIADALDTAFSVMLKCLSPVERAVFLLREVFECPFIEVSRIVGKNEANCRQILRRARERIAGRDFRYEISLEQQQAALREFLSATTSGELDGLAKALAGDATLVRDGEKLGAPPPPPIQDRSAILNFLVTRAREWKASGASFQTAAIGEVPILLAYCDGTLWNALAFVCRNGQVRTIYAITCPVRLRSLSAQCPPPGTIEDHP